jgi:uracil-DNA glycosylase family 4
MRSVNRASFPDWHNAPVASWGPLDAPILVLGMAPGLRGANRTGRPFTGDHAGRLLYQTLLAQGLARGQYEERPDDGLVLTGCRVTNAVRCVPPANLPMPTEIRACNGFLRGELAAMPRLRLVLALGTLAHAALLRALGLKQAAAKFAHGAVHALPDGRLLADSYHVSRYNTSTRRLTPAMFEAVVVAAIRLASGPG